MASNGGSDSSRDTCEEGKSPGERPFLCDVCEARFNRRSTLWNHKRIHSEYRPFVCTTCNHRFKWKNSLKCHQAMHSRRGEKGQTNHPQPKRPKRTRSMDEAEEGDEPDAPQYISLNNGVSYAAPTPDYVYVERAASGGSGHCRLEDDGEARADANQAKVLPCHMW